ncbi:hypothetical protein ABMA28_005886 [Loxostege sticticalis]|uniref:Peptidase S1 domain-containing protein n=1 Tax=Loxostege sticticalis TaxID=481309 RepID=A0ABD0SNR8_LOXSC
MRSFVLLTIFLITVQPFEAKDGGHTRRAKRRNSESEKPVSTDPPVTTTTEEPNPCLIKYQPQVPDFRGPGRRLSDVKCYEYIYDIKVREEKLRLELACADYRLRHPGPNFPHFAVGGREALPGEFPHMGAIGWEATVGTWIFKCGGSLISDKFVLTAAHCSKASERDTSVANVVPKIVRLGDVNIIDRYANNSFPTEANIKRIIEHPNYKSPKKNFDIALIELAYPVEFNKFIQPACVWTGNSGALVGQKATLTGWGVIETVSRTTSPDLQAAVVEIFASPFCDTLLTPSCNRHWCGMQDHQLCAGKLAGGVDACQGDSGGPLQIKIPLPNTTKGRMYHIVGITSFGIGCGLPNLPGIYTRVSSFVDWIEDINIKYKNDSVLVMKTCVVLPIVLLTVLPRYLEANYVSQSRRVKRQDDRWSWGYADVTELNKNPENEEQVSPDLENTTEEPAFCSYQQPKVPDFRAPGRRLSDVKCYEYIYDIKSREEKTRNEDACIAYRKKQGTYFGIEAIGGRDALPAEFPHMGAIGWQAAEGTWIFKCGGSLISDKFVLTAAHCSKASERDTSVADVVPKIVRLGDRNIVDNYANDIFPTTADIKRVIEHPSYKAPKKYFDVALIELTEPVLFNDFVHPACLWTGDTNALVGQKATLTGWGVVETVSRTTSPLLQAAVVDIFDSNLCDRLLTPSCNRHWCQMQDHQLCAGKLAGGVDACQGDSGGPLQIKIPLPPSTKGLMYHIVGVTSFGIGCALPNLPGIYTRVSSFIDWIEDNVWK